MSNALTEYEEAMLYMGYRDDPIAMMEELFDIPIWSGMRLIVDTVWKYKRTSVRACHGISKTITAAAIAVTFLNLFPDSVVITTAPTGRQVRDHLWKEIGMIYDRHPSVLVGELQANQRIKVASESYMLGFSTDNASRLEGYHAPYILWVLDEAKGVPRWIYDAIEGSLTGCRMGRVLEISTTDGADQQCLFRKHHSTGRIGWQSIHLSAFDSPFLDPRDYEKYKNIMNPRLFKYGRPTEGPEWDIEKTGPIPIVDGDWIEDKEQTWKLYDPYMWETKVLGEFSELGGDNIIPLSWVESAVHGTLTPPKKAEPVYGLDVSRMGDDQTVLYPRRGGYFYDPIIWEKKNTMETAGKTKIEIDNMGRGTVRVDMIGVGAGVFDRLDELGMPAIGVNSAEKAYDNKTYFNLRAEMWFYARTVFEWQYKEGNILRIPDDPELIEDLTGMKYVTHSTGRLIAEKKEKFKERFGRSPNKGDAFVYCLFNFPAQVQDTIEWAI